MLSKIINPWADQTAGLEKRQDWAKSRRGMTAFLPGPVVLSSPAIWPDLCVQRPSASLFMVDHYSSLHRHPVDSSRGPFRQSRTCPCRQSVDR